MVRVGMVVRSLTLCGLAFAGSASMTLAFAQTSNSKTIVTYPSGFAVSRPLSELPIEQSLFAGEEIHEPGAGPLRSKAAITPFTQQDSALQKENGSLVPAAHGIDFDGISSPGYAPSDSNLAVGPNYIVEAVNVQYAVYSKTGAIVAGPTNVLTLFSALSGDCSAGTYGDPVVLYDRPADRWLISMIGRGAASTSECVAVSKTNDPAGAYYLYGYSFGTNLNDYPKLGTWATATNSAYLVAYNIFAGGQIFSGADLCGFDRTKMLAGVSTAAQLCKMTPNNDGGYLPSDIDGPTTPTDGTPGLFIAWFNNSPGQLYLRKLTMNFATATATLSSPTVISVASSNLACGGGACIPQLGTTQTLDSLGDRLMYRFAIRHFADHDRAVVNHSVATTSGQVGVRWYELFDPAGTVTLNQQGTFAPADTNYRWMGSLAEDQKGDIGLGYSLSSAATHPAISFTGRVPTDAAGTMDTEDIFLTGGGSQGSTTQSLSRWGDYTAMQVDPADDCTFWYVNQYEQTSGIFNWHTRIGSFIFSGCSGGGGPIVSLTPASLTFSKTVINTTSPAKSVTVSNTGTAVLNISSIATSGDFALATSTKPCGSTLAAGISCIVKVTFTPTQLGTRTGNLTIKDDATNSPQNVPLTGTGALPATLTPTSATFASQTVGTTSAAKVFTLTNNQTLALNNIASSITGDFKTLSTTCTTSLAAKTHCTISVVFKPTATGTRTGTLSVSDSANNSPQKSSLTGTGK
jgi:hypothetical protein